MEFLSQSGIISKVSSQWRPLGLRFGLSTNTLDGYEKKAMLDNDTCCEKVFDHWINNGGHPPTYPLSWKGLHAVLCDIGHRGTAQELNL
jgi:hypothetical protein